MYSRTEGRTLSFELVERAVQLIMEGAKLIATNLDPNCPTQTGTRPGCGAVVALLGIMSNLVGKSDGAILARYLSLPLLQFGLGVLAGALGFAFRYFSQSCYSGSEDPNDKLHLAGNWLRYGAIASALAGYVLFGFAVINSYQSVVWAFAA